MDLRTLEYYLREWPGKNADVIIKTPDGVLLDPVYVDLVDGELTITN